MYDSDQSRLSPIVSDDLMSRTADQIRAAFEQEQDRIAMACLQCMKLGEDYVVVVSEGRSSVVVVDTSDFGSPKMEYEIGRAITVCRESDIGEHSWPCTIYHPNQASAHQKLQFVVRAREKLGEELVSAILNP